MPNTGRNYRHPPAIHHIGRRDETMPKRFNKPRRLYDYPTVQQNC